MSTIHNVPLRRGNSIEYVDARLHERIDVEYATFAQQQWQAYAAERTKAVAAGGAHVPHQQHRHWEWDTKVGLSQHLLSCPTLAIDAEGATQGMMLLITDGNFARLPEVKARPLVYVEYLASAPWNLPAYSQEPQFKGTGTLLIRAAIQQSLELEFQGRVGLHSLPQSEAFYERIGFVCLGQDENKENLKYYELSAEAAAKFMK